MENDSWSQWSQLANVRVVLHFRAESSSTLRFQHALSVHAPGGSAWTSEAGDWKPLDVPIDPLSISVGSARKYRRIALSVGNPDGSRSPS
jgi:hypothetical protein